MTNEPSPNDTRDQPEHARQFAQVSRNIKVLADQLVRQHPEFGVDNFGRAFAVTAIALMLDAAGQRETVQYLRELARDLEAGAQTSN